MACGCKGTKKETYRWTSGDGNQTIGGLSKVQADTKMNRRGGTVVKE